MIEIHGHRGCRGLYPENSIPAFMYALELGVHALEMDVVVSADRKIVVSHEPYFNHTICTHPNGNKLTVEQEHTFNLFKMPYESIAAFDCGSIQHPSFPEQKSLSTCKPLFSDVIKISEEYCLKHHRALPFYNIETKCTPLGDNLFHPTPELFTDLLMAEIEINRIEHRCIIQSFDLRVLKYLHTEYPQIKTSLLAESSMSYNDLRLELGFKPDYYSPHLSNVSQSLINTLRSEEVLLLPWTVNEIQLMKEMIRFGVDGIITDYPNRLLQVLHQLPD
ncbi:MAG TPA: glycerophosphodiester phosphodiesterase family protein [Bacteroidia bacterium]|nr:glycerophosphodiester phosphodiesterase family protein [Bacteroidia bacterium]HNT79946.1 glycerophosphodiester phosphodiesterase family protein [Bacteroidia bacterium]